MKLNGHISAGNAPRPPSKETQMSRRKSAEHHKVMGTYRAARHRPALAFPKGASCPSWLTNQAKREWRRVAPLLEAQNILQKSDTMILAAYCEAFANWRDAVKHVEAEGAIIQYESTTRTGRTSKPIRNPCSPPRRSSASTRSPGHDGMLRYSIQMKGRTVKGRAAHQCSAQERERRTFSSEYCRNVSWHRDVDGYRDRRSPSGHPLSR